MQSFCSYEDCGHLRLIGRAHPKLGDNIIEKKIAPFLYEVVLAACAGVELPGVLGNIYAVTSSDANQLTQISIPAPDNLELSCFTLGPHGQHMAAGYTNGHVHLFCTDGILLETYDLESADGVDTIAFAPDGVSLAAASHRVIHMIVRGKKGVFSRIQIWTVLKHKFNFCLAYMFGGKELVLGCEKNPTFGIVDISSGSARYFEKSGAECVCFACVRQGIAAGCKNGHVVFVDAASCKEVQRIDPHAKWDTDRRAVRCLSFSKDGRKLACSFDASCICLIAVVNFSILACLELPCDWIDSISFSEHAHESYVKVSKPWACKQLENEGVDQSSASDSSTPLAEVETSASHFDETEKSESCFSSDTFFHDSIFYGREASEISSDPPDEWKAWVPDVDGRRYLKCILCDKWIQNEWSHEREGGSDQHQGNMWRWQVEKGWADWVRNERGKWSINNLRSACAVSLSAENKENPADYMETRAHPSNDQLEEWQAWIPIDESYTSSKLVLKCMLCDKQIKDGSHERVGGSEKHQWWMWYIENKDDERNTWYREIFLPYRKKWV